MRSLKIPCYPRSTDEEMHLRRVKNLPRVARLGLNSADPKGRPPLTGQDPLPPPSLPSLIHTVPRSCLRSSNILSAHLVRGRGKYPNARSGVAVLREPTVLGGQGSDSSNEGRRAAGGWPRGSSGPGAQPRGAQNCFSTRRHPVHMPF